MNHPLVNEWRVGPIGRIDSLADSLGTTWHIRLDRFADNEEPTSIGSYNGAYGAGCYDSSTYAFRVIEPGFEVAYQLRHLRMSERARTIDRDALLLGINVRDPGHQHTFGFDLSAPENIDEPAVLLRHDASRDIAGRTYLDVFEHVLKVVDDLHIAPSLSPDRASVGVIVARGVGLVQLTLHDGRVFSRVAAN